jgi:sucrose-6-phosphate hydrolase SacC (GH32 family)
VRLTVAAGFAVDADVRRSLPALQSAMLTTVVTNTNNLIPGKTGNQANHHVPFAVKEGERNVTLRVFVDHSVVEAYAAGGRGCVTARTYPTDDAVGMSVFAMSSATDTTTSSSNSSVLLALDVYSMESIWVDHL